MLDGNIYSAHNPQIVGTTIDQHKVVLDAFEAIEDKNALAWSVLDNKSELAVTLAIAVTANRTAGRRVAHVEYRRIDLVLVEDSKPVNLYQAKAAYATDFQPRRLDRCDWYLGACLDDDLRKLALTVPRIPSVRCSAGLFYVYEVSEPSRQLKYGNYPCIPSNEVMAGLQSQVTAGQISEYKTIDCGEADGASVRIHLCVFDPVMPRESPDSTLSL